MAEGELAVPEAATAPRGPVRRYWISGTVGAALLIVGGVAALLLRSTPLQRLSNATRDEQGHAAMRLSEGIAWTPHSRSRGEPNENGGRATVIAAGDLWRSAEKSSGVDAQHATGVAALFLANAARGVEYLSAIPRPQRTAKIWNDLAAATYALAVDQSHAGERLIDSLVAADAALEQQPNLEEARFNRAIILETLGIRDLAVDEWKRYLDADSSSPWSVEAHDHLRRLLQKPSRFGDELDRQYFVIAKQPSVAADLAGRFPQEARTWGETEILGRWATAELRDDPAAAQHLAVARAFARVVSQRHDLLFERAIAAIDAATSDTRRVLASAHVHFREGQQAFRKMKAEDAEKLFKSADDEFARGRSPLSLAARYFRASAQYEQGRVDEAASALEELRAAASPDFQSYRAELAWELALCRSSRGRYGDAISLFSESRDLFAALDEHDNVIAMNAMLASVFDLIGDSANAWDLRTKSLLELGRTPSARLQSHLASLAALAILRRNFAAAASILRLELDIARQSHNDVFIADALLRRALVCHRSGDDTAADADLAESRVFVRRMSDPAYRSQYEERVLWVEGVLAPTPAEAISVLTRALADNAKGGRRLFVPNVLADRSNAFLAAGDDTHAAADLDAAISEMETRRELLPAGERRWGVFHAAEEIFDSAIELALKRGDVVAAYSYSEHARARTLLDSLKEPVSRAALPSGTALVEYHVGQNAVHVFVESASGLHCATIPTDRATVIGEVAALAKAISRKDGRSSQAAGRRLYDVLLSPVERWIMPSDIVVIVPDATVSAVPFSALVTGDGHFIIERHSLVIAPSAATYKLLQDNESLPAQELLVVASDPATREALPGSDAEAIMLQRLYTHVTRLTGTAATPERFATSARRAARIHFSGHGMASEILPEDTALILSDGAQGERRFDVRQIAAMRLERSPIVILAACSTSRGRVTPFEGTLSVARGFLAAGARSVVAALWPISDAESGEFFARVHEHLARGKSAAESLRAAQIDSIRLGVSPSMWAAVQDIGS